MNHGIYMRRCIELAWNGAGFTAPNPLVGCVIVSDEKIIGEGYHHAFGEPHAEVNAIASVKNKKLLESSVLYVNLEPCSHYGKTPPCTSLIIASKIPTVVIGCRDPFEKVNGSGIDMLRENNIWIINGILEKECREINKRFITFHEQKRPYIILKWAQSRNGFTGTAGKPIRISNDLSQYAVHQWRSQEQAIMIGTKTAEQDDPFLTVRKWHGKNPVRIIIDRRLRLPVTLNVFDDSAPTIIFNEVKNSEDQNLSYIKINFDEMISEVISFLYKNNIISVMIEGGSFLLEQFIAKNLWDEAFVITGNQFIESGIAAPALKDYPLHHSSLSDNNLTVYKNERA